MRSKPPTRRSRRSSNGDSSLPIIPILIGVIVLGFVIGAGLSLAGRHDVPVVAVASPSAAAATETLAPVTPAPTERPTLQPTDGPTEKPAPAPSPAATRRAVAAATSRARERASPAAASGAASPAILTTAARNAVSAAGAKSASPAQAAESAAPPAASAAAAASENRVVPANEASAAGDGTAAESGARTTATPSAAEADSAFAKLSAAVVRQYLEAVKRGDQDSAYAALGASPGAKGASLTEAGVVDSRTHVGRIDAHTAANDDALVSVQLQTPNGPYYGQYTVHKTETGAAVIVQHTIVKP